MASRPKIPGVVQQKAEPKTFFANERTFLSWLHMALTMGSISAAMLGFSTTKPSDVSWPPTKSRSLIPDTDFHASYLQGQSEVSLIALVLLPVALVVCGYALLVYHWRAQAIQEKEFSYYDDRRGPLALAGVLVAALTFIFVVGLIDFVKSLMHGPPDPPSGSPAEWFRSTLFYTLLRKPGLGH
jgi:uncharacterized membrane protein YidH (DUF202 family)